MSLRDAARNVVADALGDSPHPEPDVLIEYALGALDDETAESVRWHVSLCQTCADVVLDAARFPELASPEPLDDDALTAHWQAFRADRTAGEADTVVDPPAPSMWRATPQPVRYALAALVPLCFALAMLLASARSEHGVAPVSRIATGHVALAATRGDEVTRIVVGHETESIWLTISVPPGNGSNGTGASYRVELLEIPSRRLFWGQDGLRRQVAGYLPIQLPPSFLDPGQYDVRVLRGTTIVGTGAIEIMTEPLEGGD